MTLWNCGGDYLHRLEATQEKQRLSSDGGGQRSFSQFDATIQEAVKLIAEKTGQAR